MKTDTFFDPNALMRIKSLELRARAVVEGFWKGLHRSPYHGFSVEFTEYRQYSPGDDPRFLDWKLYGRSDRFYVRKFQEETNLRCYLLVDNSGSMDYGSGEYTKAAYARTLAATFALFLQAQGDAVGLLAFGERLGDYVPPRSRRGHLRALMHALERTAPGVTTDLHAPLERIMQLVRKRGMIVMISDLLAPIDAVEKRLGSLAACGHDISLFHVLDPAELNFTFEEPVMIEETESRRTMFIDPAVARSDYLRRLEAHFDAIQTSCRRLGVGYHRFTIDRFLELALFDFLRDRMQLGRKIAHRRRG
jgi:uncharacterized protein (DUF58 family)